MGLTNAEKVIKNAERDNIKKTLQSHDYVYETLDNLNADGRELTTSLIKQIHSNIMIHQQQATSVDQFGNKSKTPLLLGAYKRNPNNPSIAQGQVHEYCPYEHVDSEMENLVKFHEKNVRRKVNPIIQAAWLHHSFIAIHPFQDGNGPRGAGNFHDGIKKKRLFTVHSFIG